MIGGIGGAERAQQVDAVAGPDDGQIAGLCVAVRQKRAIGAASRRVQ
jgi:hypothetical protein